MSSQITVSEIETTHDHEHDYSALLIGVRASFDTMTKAHSHLFRTDAEGLNEVYLDALPAERQVHNCHACRTFLTRYGGLVAVSEKGETIPAMWSVDVPEFYQAAFRALAARVMRARIISVFLSKERIWGTPQTGEWSHMAVTPPPGMVYQEHALTAGQAMASAKENFRTVSTALTEFSAPALDQALRVLQADALARSEKFVGPATWLRALHDRPKGRLGENVLWRAIAAAPEGYCHPRDSVIGPLLEDIAADLPFEEIKARFNAKMHPLRYQRPQAAPRAGNIKAAEALVEKLGIAPALERRFARIDEVQTIWRPVPPAETQATGGVFGHLTPRNAGGVAALDIPATTMTWEKFARTVLPEAARIDVRVPARGNFEAYLTAAHDDAPLIFKWGNPFSEYGYHGGSLATQWGLVAGKWTPVLAISPRPNLWGYPKPHLGESLMLVIQGAEDQRTGQGNALFPETLKDELHAVRATIEAYSRAAEIRRTDGQLACGLGLPKIAAECTLRAFTAGAWSVYHIDRWD